MIKEFKHYSGDIIEDCDVCVIGSGAGGAVVAREVAEKGFSVVLVEEGSYFTKGDWSEKPSRALVDMYRHGGSTGTLGNSFIITTMGRCIGGTTTINSATCFRTPERILRKWQDELGLDQLTEKNLGKYFKKVEKTINVTELTWDVLGNNARIVKRGADLLGLHCRPLKHNVKNCLGCGNCQFGCLENAKQSMDISYIPIAVKHGARVYADCRAEKLIIKNKTAAGVVCSLIDPATHKRKYSMTVKSKVVVVCCGALITPSFLMKNGLKNRNIGRHLQIHPASRVLALMKEKVEGWKGVSQGAYIDDYENEGIALEGIFIPPSLLLATLPGMGMAHKELAVNLDRLAAFGIMVHDTTEGRVLKGFGASGYIALYNMNKIDVDKMKRGIAYTAKIFFAAGAQKVFTSISKKSVLNSPAEADELLGMKVRANQIEMMAFHPLGTCRMASDPGLGAIDGTGETFDVKNLYVADGSAVPTSLGVNPQVTIMTLATLISEGIVRKL
jgi:choline dehydrogenase-like flavoprotein